MRFAKILSLSAAGCALAVFSASVTPVYSQTESMVLPKLPDPLQNLANEGAQIRFLGKDFGLDGWVAIKNGQEQYFYVLPDGRGFVSGILFDSTGKAVTVQQVSRLRDQDGGLLDALTADPQMNTANAAPQETQYEFKSPAEQLFSDIENSNWVPVGRAGTPVFYSFIDPACTHCHAMMKDMQPLIKAGKVQVRLVPIGFKESTRAQAAYLLATPNPEEAWWRHMDGDANALPARDEINQQGVQRNLSIMQSWKLQVTPLIVYRGKDGKVKIVRGKPNDQDALVNDIGART